MKITRRYIANHCGVDITDVEQIGSKQLFIINNFLPSASKPVEIILVSYYTIVGKLVAGTWHLTTQKYSVTTSKQLSQFARGRTVIYTDNLENVGQ